MVQLFISCLTGQGFTDHDQVALMTTDMTTWSVNLFERRAAANWNIRVFKISLATSGTNLHIQPLQKGSINVSSTDKDGYGRINGRVIRTIFDFIQRYHNRRVYTPDSSCSTSLCCQKATSLLVYGSWFTHCKYQIDPV